MDGDSSDSDYAPVLESAARQKGDNGDSSSGGRIGGGHALPAAACPDDPWAACSAPGNPFLLLASCEPDMGHIKRTTPEAPLRVSGPHIV